MACFVCCAWIYSKYKSILLSSDSDNIAIMLIVSTLLICGAKVIRHCTIIDDFATTYIKSQYINNYYDQDNILEEKVNPNYLLTQIKKMASDKIKELDPKTEKQKEKDKQNLYNLIINPENKELPKVNTENYIQLFTLVKFLEYKLEPDFDKKINILKECFKDGQKQSQPFIQLYILQELLSNDKITLTDFEIDLTLDHQNSIVNKLKILQMIYKIHDKNLTPSFITRNAYSTSDQKIEPMMAKLSAYKLLQFALDNLNELEKEKIKKIEGVDIQMNKQDIETALKTLKEQMLEHIKKYKHQN